MTIRPAYAPILMGDEEAAFYLSISPRQLARFQAESLIIPRALGGKRGFLREDLDEFARNLPDWEKRGKSA